MAIKGVALSRQKKGRHIIVSSIEHHSVLNCARFLERLDFEVTFLPVDQYGLVSPERLIKSITPETILVSIMHANNEIGTIEPIPELASICREKGIFFHTDAVASVGHVAVDVNELKTDLMSFSGASMGGPKGIGALYFDKKVRLMPLIHGGIQESGRRCGTENIPGIVGLGKASELALSGLSNRMLHVKTLRDHLINELQKRVEKIKLTGHPEHRLPGHASFCVEGIEGESLIYMLAQDGIYTNTGSACASKALKTSPVLGAIGIPADLAQGSIVFTLDQSNTKQEIDFLLDKFPRAVDRLRSMSPIWNRTTPVSTAAACVE